MKKELTTANAEEQVLVTLNSQDGKITPSFAFSPRITPIELSFQMDVNIKKLDSSAVVPTYAKNGDAGLDLTATSMSIQNVKNDINIQYIEYGTGLAIQIPKGYVGLLYPRSSISKTDLVLANSVGVIDSGYRGEIKLRFKVTDRKDRNIYTVGEKVAQLVIMPYPEVRLVEVNELDYTERGEGGFGSTGV